eukprot:1943377-Karenia_brevis.AAC.1
MIAKLGAAVQRLSVTTAMSSAKAATQPFRPTSSVTLSSNTFTHIAKRRPDSGQPCLTPENTETP